MGSVDMGPGDFVKIIPSFCDQSKFCFMLIALIIVLFVTELNI